LSIQEVVSMPGAILDGLSLVDASGYVIIAAIVASLVASIAANLFIRARYASMSQDLRKSRTGDEPFAHPVLNRIVRDARDAARRRPREVNTQAIIEENFQSQLGWLLLGERFIRSATGLVLILGLSGTFYGLTLSIGKLSRLLSIEGAKVSDIANSLTTGLTQALSGMSVAFSGSLFGIVSAIVLTVFGVFSNLTDRRTALMVQIEAYLDHAFGAAAGDATFAPSPRPSAVSGDEKLERIVVDFGQSVARLEGAVADFDAALQKFANSTRDFREFNLHLKDNVQRMSLSFGDFSETLKVQIGALKSTNGS
jgi:methyl-accepting chemotaxis protein